MPTVAGPDIAQGYELLKQQRLPEAEAIFSKALTEGRDVAESLYGLGLVQLTSKNIVGARRLFESCLTQQPTHSNASYYLGQLSESGSDQASAIIYYQQALHSNPRHQGASTRLTALGVPLQGAVEPAGSSGLHGVSTGPVIAADPAGSPTASAGIANEIGGHDFYGLLHRSTEPVEREIVRLLDEIEQIMSPRRARVRAYLGRILLVIALPFVLSFFSQVFGSRLLYELIALVVGLSPIYIIGLILSIRSNRLRCERYVVIRERGLLIRKTQRDHLWMLSRWKQPEVERSLFNRWTDDGVLKIGHANYAGFFKGDELARLQANFSQLSLLMPTSRLVLSAIGELKNIRSGG